jgi:ATP synthase protein I
MSEPKNPWVQTGEVFSIGMLILVSTLVGLGLGYWLDNKFGTTPWLAFIFTLLGVAAGLYETIRILIRVTRD